MPQVVFLSIFLGLVTGMQTVALRVDPAVKSVRIELGGEEAARLTGPPWTARIDFGTTLIPRELVAIAYDASGRELARDSQLTNLSPPPVQLDIIIHSESQRPMEAELAGRHRIHKHPEAATLLLDGKPLKLNRSFRAKLPTLELARTHVLSAEMRFEDGLVARRDLVLEGEFSRSTGNELTAMLVSLTGNSEPPSLDGCFSVNGTALRASAIEKSEALVIMVKDPESRDLLARLLIDGNRPDLSLGPDATERIVWPVARPFNAPGQPVAVAFPQSNDRGTTPVTTSRGTPTIPWLLTLGLKPLPDANEPRQYADAVAVAGMSARERGRRAVVLLLGKKRDQSLYAATVVRRYLQEVGVPLLVWSPDGPRPDLANAWGTVDDVSTPLGLLAATARLNQMLAQQRIVWLAADPLTALHAEASPRCGLTPVAHHQELAMTKGSAPH